MLGLCFMASASATALTFDMLRLSPAPSRPQSARKSPRDFPAHILGDVHLPNSADRAIGGAVSAGLNPIIDAKGNIPPAMLAGIETLVGGGAAAALGFNAQGAATAAQNEMLNNYLNHVQTANFVASLKSCAPSDTACISQVTASYQSISTQQQRDAQNCNTVMGCATIKNDTLSGYGISASDAQSYCQGNATCMVFATGLANQDVAAKSIATTNWNDVSIAVYMQNAQQALISSRFSPATAAVLSAATPLDAAGATQAITGSSASSGPKVPQNLLPFTNPPQAPVIPSDWVSRPGRTPGSIIYCPPGTDPSVAGSTYIRVMSPGHTPVPGLENGYWTSAVNGQSIPLTDRRGRPKGILIFIFPLTLCRRLGN
ncbi:hypothetical protein [Burkholderia gladioli]|uniref:hypothetical protein n=1 Tax=Burkholderia gladioli TaxID=28095 RepID=UPI00163E9345|nr:hypothetical protein [Burkholderia gladioli]